MVLVQEDWQAAAEPTHQLARRLAREALWALSIVAVVVFALWFFVVRTAGELLDARKTSHQSKSPIAALPTLGMPTETRR